MTDGSNLKVLFTRFDYASTDGKLYYVETKQYPTDEAYTCNEMNGYYIMKIGNYGLECSFKFQTLKGIDVFKSDAIGGGGSSVYFQKDKILIELTVFSSNKIDNIRDDIMIGQLIDSFVASSTLQ